MKYFITLMGLALVLGFTPGDAFGIGGEGMGGKGYMGGAGGTTDAPEPDEGGIPDDVDGPLNDKGSVQGELYGDLYVILRYPGVVPKNVPKVDASGEPVLVPTDWTDPDGGEHTVLQQDWVIDTAVGGEPILTENFVAYQVADEETGELLICPQTGNEWWPAPTPSQCVQPLANYERWGDLSSSENANAYPEYADIERNKIPLVMTYDPTWDRTEAAVGTVDEPLYFIPPGGQWWDPKNGMVVYPDGVLWTELIQEVGFGRLNQARSPDSVSQSSFDEAIRSINQAVADFPGTGVRVDHMGRFLLTKYVYDEYLVYTQSGTDPDYGVEVESGDPLITGVITKAVDSPLENLAIYYKLMMDGHLVTPGDERAAIDRSERGGIPADIELEDGPSTALRPTVDIVGLRECGLDHLVDVDQETYYTYLDEDNALQVVTTEPTGESEYEEWVGIPTAVESAPEGPDFEFCASTLAAAADKGGKLTIDHVVYLNSIMGINKVVGTSEDGTDYAEHPVYFNYEGTPVYDRAQVFNTRGFYDYGSGGGGDPVYTGDVLVLAVASGTGGDPIPGSDPTGDWVESMVPIIDGDTDYVGFRNLEVDPNTGFPVYLTATIDIAGFVQQADDDLSLIDFVHTYQVPDSR